MRVLFAPSRDWLSQRCMLRRVGGGEPLRHTCRHGQRWRVGRCLEKRVSHQHWRPGVARTRMNPATPGRAHACGATRKAAAHACATVAGSHVRVRVANRRPAPRAPPAGTPCRQQYEPCSPARVMRCFFSWAGTAAGTIALSDTDWRVGTCRQMIGHCELGDGHTGRRGATH